MRRFRSLLVKTALVVLGLTPVLQAQQSNTGGPEFCPPLDAFLTPTLLDALIYPGVTFF